MFQASGLGMAVQFCILIDYRNCTSNLVVVYLLKEMFLVRFEEESGSRE